MHFRVDPRRLSWLACTDLALTLALISPLAVHAAETLLCHVDYGGQARVLTAEAVTSPYQVPVQAIGSYFLLRMVFEPSQATIKIYVFADRESGPTPIHQVTHRYPPHVDPQARYGFTGLNQVYEPVRDGELRYWCTLPPLDEKTP